MPDVRGWKHPMLIDTFRTLEAARRSFPHVSRFSRVCLGPVQLHPRTREPFRPVVSPRALTVAADLT